jgi:hypothetical protein
MKKTILNLIFFALSIIMLGCQFMQPVTEHTYILADCLKDSSKFHHFNRQYFYMAPNNGYAFNLTIQNNFKDLLKQRCKILDSIKDPLGVSIIHYFPETDGTLDVTHLVLEGIYSTNYVIGTVFNKFVCSIDSLDSDTLNANAKNRVGITDYDFKWSFIYKGEIRKKANFDEEQTKYYTQGMLAHECGHQMGIVGHQENCGGSDFNSCIMHDTTIYEFVYPGPTYCNTHACSLYQLSQDEYLKQPITSSSFDKYINLFNSSNKYLQVKIQITKDSFNEGEHILLKCIIKNISNEKVTLVNFHTDTRQMYFIKNNNGLNLKYKSDHGLYMSPTYTEIQPQKEITDDLELTGKFGDINLQSTPGSPDYYLSKGKYEVYFESKVNILENEEIKEYNLISDSNLVFNIFENQDSNASAWEELKVICKTTNVNNAFSDKMKKYKEFLNKYPESIFYDQVAYYYILLGTVARLYNKEIINDYKELIEKIANTKNTYYLYLMLYRCSRSIKINYREKAAIEYLEKLKVDYPGTNLSIQSTEILNKIFNKK